MTHRNRMLAVLMAALMLCGAFSAGAETDLAVNDVRDAGSLELLFEEDGLNAPLELNDDLALQCDSLELCDGLELVELAPEASAVDDEGGLASNAGEEIFEVNKNGVLVKYNGKDASVTIPDNVITIGTRAFEGNARLSSVFIPAAVTTIRANAFANCARLSDVTLLAEEATIVASAFEGTEPTFHVVAGSAVAKWARKQGFAVVANLIVMNRNINMNAAIGDTYQIYTDGKAAISYYSGNTGVATVSQSGEVSVLNGGTVQITVALEGGLTRMLTLVIPYPRASLSAKSLRLNVGDSQTLTVSDLSGRTVTWASGNTAVATVDGGKVTARRAGRCAVTATLSDGTELKCKVVVKDNARLSQTRLTMMAGTTATLTVSELAGRTVSWISSDTAVATVEGGRVTARRAGKCVITARLSNGSELKCKVSVKDKAKLSRTSLHLKVGGSHTLTVSGLAGRMVSWSSSNVSVATVQSGRVTAKKAGTCTITAQVQNGKALKCQVTVKDDAKLSRTSISLKVGGSYTLSVKHLGGRTVSWSSSNAAVASVQGGKVVAHKGGTCTITARLSDGRTFTCKVTVTELAPKLSRTELTLKEEQTFKLTISNLGSNTVGWQSSDVSIATVDNNGVITARKAGSCIITARLSNGTSLQCKLTVNPK